MRRAQVSPIKDADLLLLIREEEIFAFRIRDSLVFSEDELSRNPVPTVELERVLQEQRKSTYSRPKTVEEEQVFTIKPNRKGKPSGSSVINTEPSQSYLNPQPDKRRTVDEADDIFGETGNKKIKYNYADLIAIREGKLKASVRDLRPIANFWRINPKFNKEEMLTQIIIQYSRRFPEEVEAYQKRSIMSKGRYKVKRRG